MQEYQSKTGESTKPSPPQTGHKPTPAKNKLFKKQEKHLQVTDS